MRMMIYNVIMTLMIMAYGIFFYWKGSWFKKSYSVALTFALAFFYALMLVSTLILAWSVVAIRKMLQSLPGAFSNGKLIGIHIFNSCTNVFIVFIVAIPLILLDQTDQKNVE